MRQKLPQQPKGLKVEVCLLFLAVVMLLVSIAINLSQNNTIEHIHDTKGFLLEYSAHDRKFVSHLGRNDGLKSSLVIITDGGSEALEFTTIEGREKFLYLHQGFARNRPRLKKPATPAPLKLVEDGDLYWGHANFNHKTPIAYESRLADELLYALCVGLIHADESDYDRIMKFIRRLKEKRFRQMQQTH